MAFFEDVILTDSIEVKATARDIFNFLSGIVDDDSYRAWHKEDHVRFKKNYRRRVSRFRC